MAQVEMTTEQEEQRRKAREGFNAIRAKAERGEFPNLTMEEIDTIIAEVRAERHAKMHIS